MKKLYIALAIACSLFTASYVFGLGEGGIQGGGGSGTTNASDLSSGTLPAARIGDNTITSAKLLDNTVASGKIADGTIVDADINASAAIAATKIDLSSYAPLVSPTFTSPTLGAATATTLNTGQGAYELYAMDQNMRTTDNVIFNTVTASEFVSSAADNTRGVTVPNTADPTGANLAGGKMWVTDNSVKVRSNDNTVTFIAGSLIKTFSFVIDNVVVATDNILLMKVPRAMTLTQADCYASTDNVVGSLMECASDNVTSCTELDAWTVTNSVAGFTDSSMTDGAVASGAWLRWSATSVGTTNSNKLSCTIRYRE